MPTLSDSIYQPKESPRYCFVFGIFEDVTVDVASDFSVTLSTESCSRSLVLVLLRWHCKREHLRSHICL